MPWFASGCSNILKQVPHMRTPKPRALNMWFNKPDPTNPCAFAEICLLFFRSKILCTGVLYSDLKINNNEQSLISRSNSFLQWVRECAARTSKMAGCRSLEKYRVNTCCCLCLLILLGFIGTCCSCEPPDFMSLMLNEKFLFSPFIITRTVWARQWLIVGKYQWTVCIYREIISRTVELFELPSEISLIILI